MKEQAYAEYPVTLVAESAAAFLLEVPELTSKQLWYPKSQISSDSLEMLEGQPAGFECEVEFTEWILTEKGLI